MSTATRAVRPTAQQPTHAFVRENAARYGILAGGPDQILCNGIGEYSIGHDNPLPRRELIELQGINVGRKNESEAALADDSHALHRDWHKNPERVVWKSPAACAKDLHTLYPELIAIPESLIGLPFEDATALYDAALPPETRTQPLRDVIDYLSRAARIGDAKDRLRDEVLEAAQRAYGWVDRQVRDLKAEMDRSRVGGPGIRGLDAVQREYFREVKEPLPEEVPALATLAMGKELGKQFAGTSTKTDLLIEQLIEQNQLQAEANRLLQEQQASSTGGVAKPKHSRQTAAESAQ